MFTQLRFEDTSSCSLFLTRVCIWVFCFHNVAQAQQKAPVPEWEPPPVALRTKDNFPTELRIDQKIVDLQTQRISGSIRIRLGQDRGLDVYRNPFQTFSRRSIGQLAIFDHEHRYLGNLFPWYPDNSPFNHPRKTSERLWYGHGEGYFGKIFSIRTEQTLLKPLQPGRYFAQFILYTEFLGKIEYGNELARSNACEFEVKAGGEHLLEKPDAPSLKVDKRIGGEISIRLVNTEFDRGAVSVDVELVNQSSQVLEVVPFAQPVKQTPQGRFILRNGNGDLLPVHDRDFFHFDSMPTNELGQIIFPRSKTVFLPPDGILGIKVRLRLPAGLKTLQFVAYPTIWAENYFSGKPLSDWKTPSLESNIIEFK